MSQENVEIVRRSFDAMCRSDVDDLLDCYDGDAEFMPLTGTLVESGGYHGHAGIRSYFAEAAETWERLRPHADDIRTIGVLGGCAVRGKGSAVETDSPMAWVITIRAGKITSHRAYKSHGEALEAAGLRE